MAATAAASAPTPRVWITAGTVAATAVASAPAPTVVIGSVVLAYLVPEPHPHLPADHDDLIALGIEFGLAVTLLFVGGKLAAGRILRP
jgi:hypothetical protein